jgi:hypothetical protein
MPRSVTLTLVAIGLFLVLLPLALGKPGLPPALKADEAAYYLMAESLVHDFDLRFDAEDSERLFHDFHFRPARNVILLSDDGWRTAIYGKPLAYALLAAPWVAAFGANGMVSFNALLLCALVLLGARYLARINEPWLAALFSSGFFLASTLFAYVFWLQPEVLNAFCVGSALFLGLPIAESETPDSPRLAGDSARAVRSPGIPRLVLSGALLAQPTSRCCSRSRCRWWSRRSCARAARSNGCGQRSPGERAARSRSPCSPASRPRSPATRRRTSAPRRARA